MDRIKLIPTYDIPEASISEVKKAMEVINKLGINVGIGLSDKYYLIIGKLVITDIPTIEQTLRHVLEYAATLQNIIFPPPLPSIPDGGDPDYICPNCGDKCYVVGDK